MKKLKNEQQLVKLALKVGQNYAVNRGFSDFPETAHAKEKIECIYRLLVSDGLVTPLPEDQEDAQSLRHRLAVWVMKKLPPEHPLLQ
ncbi:MULTISPECIES: DUF5062 family protein [Corallincola]|uniref:DUF5062 family protein n=3 Tax=Corallincola TaxID=1775176 RepID=A0A368NG35_9GAMM|nr:MULTISPECIES: DUF5062 family protein [Corallincola]RCU49176.1 DUF5062 family protein [Corallincola holothuriorum]TAA47524.1 DUF5062 family protein [Corallincola spongiicola]TCI05206.1 DUF5062 family protein [Corallincola luteus]